MKSAASDSSPALSGSAAASAGFWAARKVRTIRGVKVSFYKRYGAFLYMDFKVAALRVKESTKCTTLEDAARVAERRIQLMQERCNGLGEMKELSARARAAVATVAEVLAALEGGDKMMEAGSLRTYKSSLLRLARVVDEEAPETVRMDAVLCRENLERFYSLAQGRDGRGVNWVNRLPCNVGINTTVRNVRALFKPAMMELKFKGLKLSPLDALKGMTKLPAAKGGFVPWPDGEWERMLSAAEDLRESNPELWLVNAMQRFLGLRNRELWHARREWITTSEDGRAWLNIEDHRDEEDEDTAENGFEILKHGRARRLELNEELKAVLLSRTGWLVAPDLARDDDRTFREDARHQFIYRTHSTWLRQFIPGRRKSCHELRMYAGSLVAKAYGLEEACYFLGHSSIATTQKFYWSFLKASPMLDGRAMLGAHALVGPREG